MHRFFNRHQCYTVQKLADGRPLEKEEVNDFHVRLYLPDHFGELRLVLITDDINEEHFVLAERVLKKKFGVSYQELFNNGLDPRYRAVKDLESRNERPADLYPEALDDESSPEESPPVAVPPEDATRQAEALVKLGELTDVSAADAWL